LNILDSPAGVEPLTAAEFGKPLPHVAVNVVSAPGQCSFMVLDEALFQLAGSYSPRTRNGSARSAGKWLSVVALKLTDRVVSSGNKRFIITS
jgi:hypothetical protein